MTSLEQYLSNLYGLPPVEMPDIHTTIVEEGRYQGGYRKQIRVSLMRAGHTCSFMLLVYEPENTRPFPLLLSANLNGNHSLVADPAVLVSSRLHKRPFAFGTPQVRQKHATHTHRFPLGMFLEKGYGVATFHHDETEPDSASERSYGIRTLYPERVGTKGEWGMLSALSFAYSRALDALLKEQIVCKPYLYGFSRAGKSALLTASLDNRFLGVIGESSGRAGGALFADEKGEPFSSMRTLFPHWLSPSFSGVLNGDQEMLLASIAPRPVVLMVGEEDWWSDPDGQERAVLSASKLRTDGAYTCIRRAGAHEPTVLGWEEALSALQTQ